MNISGQNVTVKGAKGSLSLAVHTNVLVEQEGAELKVKPVAENTAAWAMAGTMRANLANMVKGVSEGYERKLELVGVGYRASMQGKSLNLSLGFSHPIDYEVPEGITIDTPSQTEIVVSGCDRQKVGQVAAEIRGYRPPEPYKGKGVRYAGERISLKEAKKA